MKKILPILFASMLFTTLSGCGIGMLLFYRDSKIATIYRSSASKKNYFIVKANTLSHCGCTHLYIENYKNEKKEFDLLYTDNAVRKTIYTVNKNTNRIDTLILWATTTDRFTTPFDSVDVSIFKQIDSISIYKPRGIVYQVKRSNYKGFIVDPYSNH